MLMQKSLEKWSQKIGWGPFVHGDRIFWDHLSMGTELLGDRVSRGTNEFGTNCGGPNVRGPYLFGTKCVTAGGWIFTLLDKFRLIYF